LRQIVIRHEGRYSHVEKTFNPSDADLHRSHRAGTVIRSATPPNQPLRPKGIMGLGLGIICGAMVMAGIFGGCSH
jgi:hypothetical protein